MTSKKHALILAAGAATALLAAPSFAASVTEIRAETNLSVDGVVAGGDSTIAPSGAVSAMGQDGATAFQNDAGVSAVSVGGFFAEGTPGLDSTAAASITQAETNMSGGLQAYELDFTLTNMFLDLNGDFGGASPGPNPLDDPSSPAIASFLDYSISVDGVQVFSVHAELFGGGGVYATDNVVGLTGTLVGASSVFAGPSGERFEIDDLSGTVSLGSFMDGESFEVVATATVGLFGGAFENAMFANLGDPNTIATGPIRAVPAPPTPMPQVPLPATALMLITALGGLGALGARRRPAASR